MTRTTVADASADTWTDICGVEQLEEERGVAALVPGLGHDRLEQVAVFRVGPAVYAIDHRDPVTCANVLARGVVGSVGDRIVVASPLHKQRFDLETGVCLDDPTVNVRIRPVVIRDGRVLVGAAADAGATSA